MPASCKCGRKWSGLNRGVERSSALPLVPWNGDASLLAKRYTDLDKAPVDGGWITPDLAADLVRAPSGVVQTGSLLRPRDLAVHRSMLNGGQWTQVLWAVVGPVVVDVVDVLLCRDPSVNDPVLVGFDVRLPSDAPAQQDVAVRSDVPTRLVRRDLLAWRKRSDRATGSEELALAGSAPSPLWEARDGRSAVDADDGSHSWSLAVSALCHRHFSTVANFDRHKPSYDGCLWPGGITNRRTAAAVLKLSLGPLGGTWVGAGEFVRPGDDADPGMAGAA